MVVENISYFLFFDIWQTISPQLFISATQVHGQRVSNLAIIFCEIQKARFQRVDWGIILFMRTANERWRYSVTPSLIGWVHTQSDPCGLWNVKSLYHDGEQIKALIVRLKEIRTLVLLMPYRLANTCKPGPRQAAHQKKLICRLFQDSNRSLFR